MWRWIVCHQPFSRRVFFPRGEVHMVRRFLKAAAPLAMLVCAAMAPNPGGSTVAATYTAAYAAYTHRIPSFARKYNLPCSACHTAWPELNAFGQAFRDNGYQMMNDRDSPIWQNPSYIPVTFRVTPNWHREGATKQPVDPTPGVPSCVSATGVGCVPRTLMQSGFDLSGMDLATIRSVPSCRDTRKTATRAMVWRC